MTLVRRLFPAGGEKDVDNRRILRLSIVADGQISIIAAIRGKRFLLDVVAS